MNVFVSSADEFQILKLFYLFKQTNKMASKVCGNFQELKSRGWSSYLTQKNQVLEFTNLEESQIRS